MSSPIGLGPMAPQWATPDRVRRFHVELPIQGALDHDRGLAAILAGAALVADLCRDPCQLGQTGHAVQIDAFALLEKIVVELAVPVDLTAFDPGLLQQLGLADVFPGALAQWRLHPRCEPARLDAQTPAHRPDGELPAMLGHERVSHSFGMTLGPMAGSCLTPGEIRVVIVARTNGASMTTLFQDVTFLRDPRQLLLQASDLGVLLRLSR